MAKKKHKKKQKGMWFAVFMAVYALLFLAATGYGLYWLWGCMEAYEASRPHIAIDAYMANVDKEYILEHCDEYTSGVDFNIQDEDACRDIMLQSLEGEITYARKASACNETQQVYVVKCGKQVVGSFTIVATEEDAYGFTPWEFSEENYDLSHLMGTETITVTAPEGYLVYVNGVLLDESYIVQQESTHFEVFGDLYENYELPEFVLNTYKVGPFLGETYEAEVYDPQGKPFVYDETFDPSILIPACDAETTAELKAFVEEFLEIYVIFAGCANDNRHANYNRVIKYVVPDSSLAQRMLDALDGMQFAQSQGDEVDTIRIHHYVPLEEGKYLVNVTYLVNTTGYEGTVQTTSNARMIIVESGDKLLVESLIHY